MKRFFWLVVVALVAPSILAQVPPGGTPVIGADDLFTIPVGGLERTNATASVFDAGVHGRGLRVQLRQSAAETNATQLTIMNRTAIERGDALLAEILVRGRTAANRPARVEVLFERATNPWTKSMNQMAAAPREGNGWRRVLMAFESSESYAPGEAMTSIRFAQGPQTVEVAGLRVINYRKTRSLESLQALAYAGASLGTVTVRLDTRVRQTMLGLGGNFCQPRYNSSEPMDEVGRTNLAKLQVAHARIGLPLNHWAPEPGKFAETGPALASLKALQDMKRRGIPTVVSVWEGPLWLQGGQVEQSGRELDPAKYGTCIDLIARYLVLARDKYGVEPAYFSFNEPDYGVNFKFTSVTMANFIRQAGRRFAELGLKTKFLVGDTANATNFGPFVEPLLKDTTIAPYLGPLAFHSWDALNASDEAYDRIAELSVQSGKPVWCLEAGHDAQLWQARDPWASWENGFRTALAYERSVRQARSSLVSYWTYQDNYPIVSKDGKTLYPVFHVMRQMEAVFGTGRRIVLANSASEELRAVGSLDARGRPAVLLVNPVGAGKVTLTGFPSNREVAVLTNSGAVRDGRATARSNARGEVTVAIPARSVVTVVAR